MGGDFRPSDGDWTCPDEQCGNVNFARRFACNRCGKEKKLDKTKKQGIEIGSAAAEKSKGLFAAEDWQCAKCGNVNWARRSTCNVCNGPKFVEVEERTGLGGGFDERGIVEYKDRVPSDDEFDDFGRRKKKKGGASGNVQLKPQEIIAVEDDEEDEEEDDEDEDDEDVSKYDLWGNDDDDAKGAEDKKEAITPKLVLKSVEKPKEKSRSRSKEKKKGSRRSRSSSSSSSSSRSRSRSRDRRRGKSRRSRSRSSRRGRGRRHSSSSRSRSRSKRGRRSRSRSRR